MSGKNDHGTGVPRHEVESLAHLLMPRIQEFFESEKGKKEFEEWTIAQEISDDKKGEGGDKN